MNSMNQEAEVDENEDSEKDEDTETKKLRQKTMVN